ncbi:unnamed protein product [Prunus armeniaca]|uniref:Uncharacterized protein n=1 Tax=Prunus armeniaca TaxID=36596 RepID=A0A6J5TYL6_PRUAR|nr:unnamed protein product [Prunus armeniaca]
MAISAGAAVVEVLDSMEEEEEEEEVDDDKFKAWRKKNATALHAIQTSCGREAFSLIRNTTSAKRAWDTLAENFKPKPGKSPVQILNLNKSYAVCRSTNKEHPA